MELEVLPELDELLPRREEETTDLEESLKNEGCRDSLIVWKDRGIVVDGMTRYPICKKHNIPFKIIEKDFANLHDVKVWIVKNQTARRNLKPGQKAILLAKINGEKIKEERENLPPEQSKKVTETEEEIAKTADIKVATLRNAQAVIDGGSKKLQEAVTEGIISARPAKKLSRFPHEFQDKVLEELENSEEHPEVFIDTYLAEMKKEEVQKIADSETDTEKADHIKESKEDLDRLESAFSGEKTNNELDVELRKLFKQISILENLKVSEIECDGINVMKFVCPKCGKTISEILDSLVRKGEENS